MLGGISAGGLGYCARQQVELGLISHEIAGLDSDSLISYEILPVEGELTHTHSQAFVTCQYIKELIFDDAPHRVAQQMRSRERSALGKVIIHS